MEYTGLTDERSSWHQQLKEGIALSIDILQQYRVNRHSNLWRATREVEKLCEYILFLEEVNSMNQIPPLLCDSCQKPLER